MTYCLAIHLNEYLIFAGDSRTSAGVDNVTVYSKMHQFPLGDDRLFVALTAGNLATSQAVFSRIQRDLDNPHAKESLRTADYLFDAAHYIGRISRQVQEEHSDAFTEGHGSAEASFILGGQIRGRPHNSYLIYPQGNCITASPKAPFLQIGETKYGKPILDRVITLDTSLGDAIRCALMSISSTMRSNISVGPPIEVAVYARESFAITHHMVLDNDSRLLQEMEESWSRGLRRALSKLPRFDWEEEAGPREMQSR
ncbi:MAG: peptidase [Alphaproteobacteria bacterium]|nr:peptidase [Alphaproteobacteria bacterium]